MAIQSLACVDRVLVNAAVSIMMELLGTQDGAVKEVVKPYRGDFCVAGQPPGPEVLSQAHQLMREAALRLVAS